jgi:hypothetical protein
MADDAIQANTLPDVRELQEIDLSSYRLTPKFEAWRRMYMDSSNKETFGNATRSALKAYNLDSQTQYGSAGVIGHENLKRLNNLRMIVREYLEENGFTLPVLINHALQKMADPRVLNPHWWKEIMKLAGYIDEKPTVAIQNNLQINDKAQTQQISPEEQKQLSQDFAEYLNAKYRGKPAMNPDATS